MAAGVEQVDVDVGPDAQEAPPAQNQGRSEQVRSQRLKLMIAGVLSVV